MRILLYHAVYLTTIVTLVYLLHVQTVSASDAAPFVYVITVPKNNHEKACLKMEATFLFTVNYKAKDGNDTINRTVDFTFEHIDFDYTGSCLNDVNMVEFEFLDDWRLELRFQQNNQTFSLYHVTLYYDFNHPLFPNSIEHGAHSELYDGDLLNGTLGQSFKCDHGFLIDLQDVKLNMTNLRLEPFFNKPPNFPYSKDEEVCFADEPIIPHKRVEILMPTAIGGAVALIIVICIVAFCIYSKKSRRADYNELAPPGTTN